MTMGLYQRLVDTQEAMHIDLVSTFLHHQKSTILDEYTRLCHIEKIILK